MKLTFLDASGTVGSQPVGRAIEHPAIDIWKGKEANVAKAQKSLYHRAKCNAVARRGEYDASMKKETRGQNG